MITTLVYSWLAMIIWVSDLSVEKVQKLESDRNNEEIYTILVFRPGECKLC